jgi:hypothetical protein
VDYIQSNSTSKNIRGGSKQYFLSSFAFAILTGIINFDINFDIPKYCVSSIPISYSSICAFYLSVTTFIVQSFKNLLLLFGRVDHTTKGNVFGVVTKKVAVNYAEARSFFLESVPFLIRYMFNPDRSPQRCKPFSNHLKAERVNVVEFRCMASGNEVYTDRKEYCINEIVDIHLVFFIVIVRLRFWATGKTVRSSILNTRNIANIKVEQTDSRKSADNQCFR